MRRGERGGKSRRNNGASWRKFKVKGALEGLALSIKCPNLKVTHITARNSLCRTSHMASPNLRGPRKCYSTMSLECGKLKTSGEAELVIPTVGPKSSSTGIPTNDLTGSPCPRISWPWRILHPVIFPQHRLSAVQKAIIEEKSGWFKVTGCWVLFGSLLRWACCLLSLVQTHDDLQFIRVASFSLFLFLLPSWHMGRFFGSHKDPSASLYVDVDSN